MRLSPLTVALVRNAMWDVACSVQQIRNGVLRSPDSRFLAAVVRSDLRSARTVMAALRDTCPARYREALKVARQTLPQIRAKLAAPGGAQ